MADLPLVLAGPILRRVEASRACVWIAISHSARITGLVYNAASTEQLGEGKTETLPLGKALHVAVVEIVPTPTRASSQSNKGIFPARSFLAYDLILELVSSDGKTLAKYLLSNLTSSGTQNLLAYSPYFVREIR